jgi:hypothetical protein
MPAPGSRPANSTTLTAPSTGPAGRCPRPLLAAAAGHRAARRRAGGQPPPRRSFAAVVASARRPIASRLASAWHTAWAGKRIVICHHDCHCSGSAASRAVPTIRGPCRHAFLSSGPRRRASSVRRGATSCRRSSKGARANLCGIGRFTSAVPARSLTRDGRLPVGESVRTRGPRSRPIFPSGEVHGDVVHSRLRHRPRR